MKFYVFTIAFIIFISLLEVKAQGENYGELKTDAVKLMDDGRYGDAVDLLNKYLSANPREPEGYELRGLCFEKREQYEKSVLDLRRASVLDPHNPRISRNLDRVLTTWHTLLYSRIEGYRREIAINPNDAENYLQVGKCYKYLEKWTSAEEWYDKYLSLDDDASPDEILRYTEILSRTGNLSKGERILKKYVERYPDDWRLWSRYGFYTLWLGKYTTAKKAFEMSLGFKPYFQEAEEGLELATNRPYVVSYLPKSYGKEYPVDRYYRSLKNNPGDEEIRLKLADELIKENRIEEAYNQIQTLVSLNPDDSIYSNKLAYITNLRNTTYRSIISELREKLTNNHADLQAINKLTEYLILLNNFDEAAVELENFINKNPGIDAPELKFKYAQLNAWDQKYDIASNILDRLLDGYPDNLKYQLLKAQISVWTNGNLSQAEKYLTNILRSDSNNVEALLTTAYLNVLLENFESAQACLDKVYYLDPANRELSNVQTSINSGKISLKRHELYTKAVNLYLEGDCKNAALVYEEFMSISEVDSSISKEYADILVCAGEFDKALKYYDEALSFNYSFNAAYDRASLLWKMRDTLQALDAYRKLASRYPGNFYAHLYLGDIYRSLEKNDSALAVYEVLSNQPLDSAERSIINQRINWTPGSGLSSLISNFPSYMSLAPLTSYYSDNISFKFARTGLTIDIGVGRVVTVGASIIRNFLDSDSLNTSYTEFTGNLTFRIAENFYIGGKLGRLNSEDFRSRDIYSAFLRIEKLNTYSFRVNYQTGTASLMLYSPHLVGRSFDAYSFNASGEYFHPAGIYLSGDYHYARVKEANYLYKYNYGQQLALKLGRIFPGNLTAGYEFDYWNYKHRTVLYYSPSNFESHSLWISWDLEKTSDHRFTVGGRLGYIPSNDFYIREIFAEGKYFPLQNLAISGKILIGSSYKFDAGYNYFSGYATVYWTFY